MTKKEYQNLITRYKLLNETTSPVTIKSMIELQDFVLTSLRNIDDKEERWNNRINLRIKRQQILQQLAQWEKSNN